MFEFIFQIIGEILIQAIGEALFELGLHSLAEPFRKPPNPWLAALGYALFGAAAGGISVALFPSHFVVGETLRLVNLVVTPVVVGLLMCLMGAWRAKRGQAVLRIDRFSYGFLFAFFLALVRFGFAK
ncbi:hypothetical protein [Ottowia thiooxydans]|uniref:hypothetical protein n=1 Tax=Ottowia thiooxydans TaxID=219182 RepID=UPI000490F1B1|nr:hypothetical protein [Ottowia thiooxydans]